jgi:hypothetical protein
MVGEDIISVLPEYIANNINTLITIFKAVGIAILVYIVYLFIRGIFIYKRIKRMKNIEKKVLEIDRKLDRLLENKNSKRKKSKK